ncbi:hypothetical protein NESM_000143200 [Novymonas esmeraldas]|uniref:Uncharacterized protein n=1 Tax=Novymonas esmeraldas TaxID=1808958 RepID=A0AAW0F6T4_9TRYP
MFDSLRLLVLSCLYYFGFTYAAFIALKQRSTTVVSSHSQSSPSPSSTAEDGRPQRRMVLIGIPALKLMIMLTSMALLSLVGADWFPLFAEMRVILMYTLLFAPPFTQQELYDQLFAPLLVRGGAFAVSLQTNDVLSRKLSLFVVRRCVDVSIAAMNYTQRSRSVDNDAVRDILSGLRFSQRALQQVADMARESDGVAYAQLAQDSNFAVGIFTSHVRRALVAEEEEESREGEVNARVPLGRVVREDHADPARSLPTATASTSAMSPLSDTRSDSNGLVESLHSVVSHTSSETSDGGRSDRSRRGERKRKRLFGLF